MLALARYLEVTESHLSRGVSQQAGGDTDEDFFWNKKTQIDESTKTKQHLNINWTNEEISCRSKVLIVILTGVSIILSTPLTRVNAGYIKETVCKTQ